jgi:hypothetical protein
MKKASENQNFDGKVRFSPIVNKRSSPKKDLYTKND